MSTVLCSGINEFCSSRSLETRAAAPRHARIYVRDDERQIWTHFEVVRRTDSLVYAQPHIMVPFGRTPFDYDSLWQLIFLKEVILRLKMILFNSVT